MKTIQKLASSAAAKHPMTETQNMADEVKKHPHLGYLSSSGNETLTGFRSS